MDPLHDPPDSSVRALQAVLDRTYEALARHDPTKGLAEPRAEEPEEDDADPS